MPKILLTGASGTLGTHMRAWFAARGRPVLAQPLQVIEKLYAHRMAREAKVKAAMAQKPDGTPEDWVALAYADTPEKLWPVAKRSLLAHVEHIRGL